MPTHSIPNATCQQCGTSFHAKSHPSRSATGRGKFCSKQCYYDSKKRFEADAWNHVDKSGGPDACWEWKGTMTVYGYGQFKCQSGIWRAHRLTYTLTNGPIPPELVVRHKCDNRRCCNPNHLELGTHDENMRDAVTRNRMASGDRSFARNNPHRLRRGDTHPNAKLTSVQATEIRRLRDETNMSLKAIADQFGVCSSTIANIIAGKIWVTPPTSD